LLIILFLLVQGHKKEEQPVDAPPRSISRSTTVNLGSKKNGARAPRESIVNAPPTDNRFRRPSRTANPSQLSSYSTDRSLFFVGLDAAEVAKRLAEQRKHDRPRTTCATNMPDRSNSLSYLKTCLARLVDKYPSDRGYSSDSDDSKERRCLKRQQAYFNNSFNHCRARNRRALPRHSLQSFGESNSKERPRAHFMIKAENMSGDHANKRLNVPQRRPVLVRLKRSTTVHERMPVGLKSNLLPTIQVVSAAPHTSRLSCDEPVKKAVRFDSSVSVRGCGSEGESSARTRLPVGTVRQGLYERGRDKWQKKILDEYDEVVESTSKTSIQRVTTHS
jgi:hypothetical protein